MGWEKKKALSTALVQQTPKVCRQLKLATGGFWFWGVVCVCVFLAGLDHFAILGGFCLVWIFAVVFLRGQESIFVQVPILEGNLCRHMPDLSYIPPTQTC